MSDDFLWCETGRKYCSEACDEWPCPEDLVRTYTCHRCGREGKSTDEDIHTWYNVNICEVDNNIWSEANDTVLCPDCSTLFNDIWFDFIVTNEKMIDSIRGHREIDLSPRKEDTNHDR